MTQTQHFEAPVAAQRGSTPLDTACAVPRRGAAKMGISLAAITAAFNNPASSLPPPQFRAPHSNPSTFSPAHEFESRRSEAAASAGSPPPSAFTPPPSAAPRLTLHSLRHRLRV